MIIGIGTDLVEVARLEKIIARWGERFLRRVYSAQEIAYCEGRKLPVIHYAARFAAKESFLKSMGIGIGEGLNLGDIEVTFRGQGRPEFLLHGRARAMLSAQGNAVVHLSMTHTKGHAAAVVVIEA